MHARSAIALALIGLACAACEGASASAGPDAVPTDAAVDAPRAHDAALDAPRPPPTDGGSFPAASYAMHAETTWLSADVRGVPSELDFTLRLDRRGTSGDVRAVIGRRGTADSVTLRHSRAAQLTLTASTARLGFTGPCAAGTLRITALDLQLLDEDGDPEIAERVQGVIEATYTHFDPSFGESAATARGMVEGALDTAPPTVELDPFVPFTDVLVRASEPLVPSASATVSIDGLAPIALARLGGSSVGGFVLPRALLRPGAEHVVELRTVVDLAGFEATPEPLVLRVPDAPGLFDDYQLEDLRTEATGELSGLDALAHGDVREVSAPLAREGEHALWLEGIDGDEDDTTTAVWLRWPGDPSSLRIDAYARTAGGGDARPLLARAFSEDDGELIAHVLMFFDAPTPDGLDAELTHATSLQQLPVWRIDGGAAIDGPVWVELRPLSAATCGTAPTAPTSGRTVVIVERIGPLI